MTDMVENLTEKKHEINYRSSWRVTWDENSASSTKMSSLTITVCRGCLFDWFSYHGFKRFKLKKKAKEPATIWYDFTESFPKVSRIPRNWMGVALGRAITSLMLLTMDTGPTRQVTWHLVLDPFFVGSIEHSKDIINTNIYIYIQYIYIYIHTDSTNTYSKKVEPATRTCFLF